MERLYTRKEAAELLGISLATLDNIKQSGAITYVQYVPNGSVFFTEEALQEYVARSTHRAIPTESKETYRTIRKRNSRMQ